MKQLIAVLAIALLYTTSTTAQALPVKLYEFTGGIKTNDGFTDSKPGKEINNFQVPADANAVRMFIEVPAVDYNRSDRRNEVHLSVTTVTNGSEVKIHDRYWNTPAKDAKLLTECFFSAGEYTISVDDNSSPKKTYAKRTIIVKSNGSKSSGFTYNGFTYDRTKFKLWSCKSVDETTWKPIEPVSKITAGSCITFFFESIEKIKNPGTMRWKIYKIEADGKETFVNQKDQNSRLPEFRRLYYEECSEFSTKGKYRIYFAIKNESEAYYGIIDKDYFAKVDLQVE